jgi:hypothetical protein
MTALLALALAGAAEAGELSWRAEREPFRLVFLDDGKTLTQQAAPSSPGPGTRLSYELENGRMQTLTDVIAATQTRSRADYLVATTEPGRHARVTVRRTERGLRVTLGLGAGSRVARVFEAFQVGEERFLGSGERPILDLTGQAVQLKVSHPCRAYAIAPFYLSSAGYGVYVDSAALGVLAFRAPHPGFQYPCDSWGVPSPTLAALQLVQIALNAPSLAYEVYAGTPAAVMRSYTAAVGRPPLPPPQQFALTQWRDRIGRLDEIVDDVTSLREAKIPLGSVILDNPWEAGGCQGALAFGNDLGDPQRLFSFLAARNVRLVTWISPLVAKSCGRQGYPADGLIDFEERYWVVDFTNPRAVSAFKAKLHRLLDSPVAGVKADRGDEVFLPGTGVFFGDPQQEHNLYPRRFAQAVTEVLRERRGRDFTTFFRTGFAGSNALVHGIWAGDQRQTWEGLRDALRMGLSAGVSGFPVWGSDTGGYANEPWDPPLTPELFLRWAQLSALSPVFEVGGAGPNATFWEFGGATVDLFRRSATLHYELFPYLYELARRATATGTPILRPLAFAYPRLGDAWWHEDQLMLGPDVLGKIVLGPIGSTGPGDTKPLKVWLPPGDWVDLFTGGVTGGGGPVTRWTSIADFPLFLRRGSAIPFNFRSPRVFAADWDLNDLDRRGRLSWTYAPAEGRRTHARYFGSRLIARARGKTIDIRLTGARRETAVRLLAVARPCGVTIDGARVREAASPAALTRLESGWLWDGGRRSAVLMRKGQPGRFDIALKLCG